MSELTYERAGPGRISEESALAIALFTVTTGIVVLTFNVAIIALWLASWIMARRLSTHTPGNGALLLMIGVIVFYPEYSTAYGGMQAKVMILSLLVFVAAVYYYPAAERNLRRERGARFVLNSWIGWGLLAYLPIVAAWLWITVAHRHAPAFLAQLQHETTGIKTAAPIITAALILPLAVAGLQNRHDFRAVRRLLEVAVIVVTLASLVEWLLHAHFVPVDTSRLIADTTRLEGISTLDSNAFGRLLVFPALVFVSAALAAPRTLGYRGWLALGLATSCIVMTQSRTSYISYTAGLAVLALLNLRKVRLWWYIFAGVSWITLLLTTTRLREAFSQGSERLTLNNLEGRVEIWRGAMQIIQSHPIFGAHPSGYANDMLSLGLFDDPLLGVSGAHNAYLAIAVEWGIPMVIIALLVMALTLLYGWRAFRVLRRRRDVTETRLFAAAAVAATVAYAAHGITEVVSPLYLFLFLGWALAARRQALLRTA